MKKVTLTLEDRVSDRLRTMCHKRGMTASALIEEWVFRADESGRHATVMPAKDPFDFSQMVRDAMASAKAKAKR